MPAEKTASFTDSEPEVHQDLPERFEDYRHQRLIKRVPTISWAGITIFLAYTLLDYYTLPPDISRITMAIRLFVVCPMIGLVLITTYLNWPSRRFAYFYLFAYVVAGTAIVAIIYTARSQQFDLPYDGLLLLMVFGYFLMGMPQSHATLGSLIVSVVYFIALYLLDSPVKELASNALFILTLNVLGTLGSALQDRSRQQLFRNEKLVAKAQAKDREEIASKTRLLATASHDLRQPLHAMNLLVETLESELEPGKHRQLAAQLKASTRQLNTMLSSLLNMSRLQTGVIETRIKTFQLSERMRFLERELQFRARQEGLNIRLEGSPHCWVRTDPLLLERILRNVCENSFVHAQATNLSITWSNQGTHILLQVRDDGLGFDQDQTSQIFEAFKRLKGRSQPGMGLGLAIVKQLCNVLEIGHGVDSSPGKGACFWFRLQAAEAVAAPESTPAPPLRFAQVHNKHIAVIDDDPAILDSTAQLLQHWGFAVSSFSEPDVAIKAIPDLKIDLLVCDYQFPEALHENGHWNGLDLIQAIRSRDRQSLPVILVTANTQANLSEEIKLHFGTDARTLTEVLYKPFSPAKFRLVIRHYLDQTTSAPQERPQTG
ncbi:MAG: hypothetical protein C9356_16380 [Oleiphilus sp.]|nr:MAG: hypothetical protein C9356_16380 [Oleiphilus sp.]